MKRLANIDWNNEDVESINYIKENADDFKSFVKKEMIDYYKDFLDDNEDWFVDEEDDEGFKVKSDEQLSKDLESRMESLTGGYLFCILDYLEAHNKKFHQTSYGCEYMNRFKDEWFMSVMRETVIPELIDYVHKRF